MPASRFKRTRSFIARYVAGPVVALVLIITGYSVYTYTARGKELHQIEQAYTVRIPQDLQLEYSERGRGGIDQNPYLLDTYRPQQPRQQTFDELKATFEGAGYTLDGGSGGFSAVNSKKGVMALVGFYTSVDSTGLIEDGGQHIVRVDIEIEQQ